MRSAAFWVTSVVLILGALTAVVAMATVEWLYPGRAQRPAISAGGLPPQAAVGPEAGLALEFLRRTSRGDLPGAAALSVAVAEDDLRAQVTVPQAKPLRAAPLPGPSGDPVDVLAWADYRRNGEWARGAYRLTLSEGKITALTGPLAPDGGHPRLDLPLLDEEGRTVDLTSYRGQGLVLVAPRSPAASFSAFLADLRATFQPYGVEVVLLMDMRSPDWVSLARNAGFQGPVWRLKAYLEDVPVVTPGPYLGAVGLLVDREGYVVSSLAVLDPHRYGLDGEEHARSITAPIFQAYGLLP